MRLVYIIHVVGHVMVTNMKIVKFKYLERRCAVFLGLFITFIDLDFEIINSNTIITDQGNKADFEGLAIASDSSAPTIGRTLRAYR